jgi:GntR family transcriptional activator of glc operon
VQTGLTKTFRMAKSMIEHGSTAVASVTNYLHKMITDGELGPEAKIPSERALSTRLGVSRAIVREALHILSGKGIIETHHGRGSFVSCALTDKRSNSAVMNLFGHDPKAVIEILEVREQLEGQACFLAAQRATARDQHRIREAFKAMENLSPKWDASLDHDFHRRIIEASHNSVLIHTLSSLKELTLISVEASVDHFDKEEGFKHLIEKHHREIYQAVSTGQAAWARTAAMDHVRHVREALQVAFDAEMRRLNTQAKVQ